MFLLFSFQRSLARSLRTRFVIIPQFVPVSTVFFRTFLALFLCLFPCGVLYITCLSSLCKVFFSFLYSLLSNAYLYRLILIVIALCLCLKYCRDFFMNKVHKLTLSAMFLAIAVILPFFFAQIPAFGQMLLPMHFPVFLCGMICGPAYGAVVGIIAPLLRSVLFAMPPLFPTAIAMCCELSTYGLISGLLYGRLNPKSLKNVYVSLIGAMLTGRLFWGAVMVLLLSTQGNSFTFKAFIYGAFLTAVPGIIIQLIIIPFIMSMLDHTGQITYHRKREGSYSSR